MQTFKKWWQLVEQNITDGNVVCIRVYALLKFSVVNSVFDSSEALVVIQMRKLRIYECFAYGNLDGDSVGSALNSLTYIAFV